MQNGTSVFDEILQCYEKNGINEKFLEDHTYQSLVSVKEKGSIELFKEISAKVYETALNCIRKKQVKKIVFLLKMTVRSGAVRNYIRDLMKHRDMKCVLR